MPPGIVHGTNDRRTLAKGSNAEGRNTLGHACTGSPTTATALSVLASGVRQLPQYVGGAKGSFGLGEDDSSIPRRLHPSSSARVSR